MKRPWIHWLLFALCLAVFTGAVLSITRRALAMEGQRQAAAAEAQRQEKIRLALWRMEAVAGALLIRENARPPHHYQAFFQPEDVILSASEALPPGRALLPSPLFDNLPDLVRLHFEKGAGENVLCSPQVPSGDQKTVAAAWYVTSPQATLAAERLAGLENLLGAHPEAIEVARQSLPRDSAPAPALPPNIPVGAPIGESQVAFNRREQVQRDNLVLSNAVQQKVDALKTPQKSAAAPAGASGETSPAARAWSGDLAARWLGEDLFLMRPARFNGQMRLQGVWLDWPQLHARLIEAARDLLPEMRLEPLRAGARDDWMALVSLPVRLVPGAVPVETSHNGSALKPALLLAWSCLLAAAAAIAFVLHRAIQLSERRAAFVSAVTHELRTPLTTFQLYSEMLADDMVAEPAQRKSYLRILCTEATRLTHLVENVLSFSRIERGRAAVRLESLGVEALLRRVTPRLRDHCEQAGLELRIETGEAARGALLRADPMTLEQILFNLADNACKYAAPSSDPRELWLRVTGAGARVCFAVRDHGPGLSSEARRKLFQPFSKSAAEAAASAPGVGLGLALCRRLARELGGELSHHRPQGGGAEFRLCLPLRGRPLS